MIDDFLEKDSEDSALLVLFHKTLTECVGNKDFVKQYDRLSHRDFGQCLRDIEAGKPPSNADKQFKKFGDFVRETVFSRLVQNSE